MTLDNQEARQHLRDACAEYRGSSYCAIMRLARYDRVPDPDCLVHMAASVLGLSPSEIVGIMDGWDGVLYGHKVFTDSTFGCVCGESMTKAWSEYDAGVRMGMELSRLF